MTEFMGERAHAGHFIRVTHIDKWMSPLRAPRECTFGFPLIRIYIHPAVVEAASANRVHIFLAQRRETFTNQLNAFFERHLYLLLRDGSPHIVIGKLSQSKRFTSDFKITMPDRQI